jgi:aspartyl-tRNA synthetase
MRILTEEIPTRIGEEVELAGWVDSRRDHGKIIFIDLRDMSGLVQMVFVPKENQELYDLADTLRPEWVIKVSGVVANRPSGMQNETLNTGKVEVKVKKLEIITKSKTPPFALDTDGHEISEDLRMQYRYLDMRRPRVAKNIRNRHKVIKFMRDFLTSEGFVEVETPSLGKSTPEGARDYLVPSRVYSGNFYALPQSPQQYKQLLMIGGMERYFQIARCFRDEDTRGDRQPEFTQLDVEMSFVEKEEILALIEKLYIKIVKELYPHKKIQQIPFPRLTYKEVMEKYGSDKPDIRQDKNDPDELAFCFIVDFPMFEWKENEKRWDAVHHPFTQPLVKDKTDFLEQFKKDPAAILAKQYDFVLNGYEIGGGSIRTHNPELLASVFEVMGNDPKAVKEKFGHLLEAFEYGVPPHGGIAPGIDRFLMIIEGEPNIREVIAFPKTGDGKDLLMGAPSEVSKEQLEELSIEIKKKK